MPKKIKNTEDITESGIPYKVITYEGGAIEKIPNQGNVSPDPEPTIFDRMTSIETDIQLIKANLGA